MNISKQRYDDLLSKEKRYDTIKYSLSAYQTTETEEARDPVRGHVVMVLDTESYVTIRIDPIKIVENCYPDLPFSLEDARFELTIKEHETGVS